MKETPFSTCFELVNGVFGYFKKPAFAGAVVVSSVWSSVTGSVTGSGANDIYFDSRVRLT